MEKARVFKGKSHRQSAYKAFTAIMAVMLGICLSVPGQLATAADVTLSVANVHKADIVLSQSNFDVNMETFETDLKQKLHDKYNIALDGDLVNVSTIETSTSAVDASGADKIFSDWASYAVPFTHSSPTTTLSWDSKSTTSASANWTLSGTKLKALTGTGNLDVFVDTSKYGYSAKESYTVQYGLEENNSSTHGEAWYFFKIDQSLKNGYGLAWDNHSACGPFSTADFKLYLVKMTNGVVSQLQSTTVSNWANAAGKYWDASIEIENDAATIKVTPGGGATGSANWTIADVSMDKTPTTTAFGIYSYTGGYFSNITKTTQSVKNFSDVLSEPTWRSNAYHFVVDVDTELKFTNNTAENALVLSRTMNDDIHFINWGSSAVQSKANTFIAANNGKGTYIEAPAQANYNNAVEKTADYIYNLIKTTPSQFVLIDEATTLTVSPASEQTGSYSTLFPNGNWRVFHDTTTLNDENGPLANPISQYSKSGVYTSDMDCTFENPGKYDIYFKDSFVYTVYAHRAPTAAFTIGQTSSGTSRTVTLTSISSDQDSERDIGYGAGIAAEKWSYMKSGSSTWTTGKLTSYTAGEVYIIRLEVTDFQGEKAYATKYVGTGQPVPSFDIVNQKFTNHYQYLEVLDSSYDPTGVDIVKWNWTVTYPDGETTQKYSYDTKDFPPVAFSECGTYKLSLAVEASTGAKSEDSLTRIFEVVPDTTPPSISIEPASQDEWATSVEVTVSTIDIGGSGVEYCKYVVTNSQATPASTAYTKQFPLPGGGNILLDSDETSLQGDVYIHAIAADYAGNVCDDKVAGPYKLDWTAPSISETTIVYENDKATLTVVAEDNESGLAGYALSTSALSSSLTDGDWKTSPSFVVDDPGLYYTFAKDVCGNISSYSSTRIYSMHAPAIVFDKAEQSSGVPLTVNISMTDDIDGCNPSNIDYIITESATAPAYSSSLWTSANATSKAITLDTTGLFYIHARGTDTHNNHGFGTAGPFIMDVDPPTVTYAEADLSNDKMVVTNVTAADQANGSGVSGYACVPTGQSPTGWTSSRTFTFDTVGSYDVYARDTFGNVSAPYTVTLPDGLRPVITADPAKSDTWVPGTSNNRIPVNITVTSSRYTPSNYKYVVSTSAMSPAKDSGSFTQVNSPSGTVTVTNSGTYYIHAVAYDNRNNSGTATFGPYLVDLLAPSVTSATASFRDDKYYVAASFTDDFSGIAAYAVVPSGTVAANVTNWVPGNDATHEFELDNGGVYWVYARDAAGNVSPYQVVTASGNKPTVSAAPSNALQVTFGESNKARDVVVTVHSVASTPKSFKYQVTSSATAPAKTDSGWADKTVGSDGKGSVSVSGDGSSYLHVIGYDTEGNSSNVTTFGAYVIDTVKPQVTSATVVPANNKASITATFSDEGTGLFGYAIIKSTAPDDSATPTANSSATHTFQVNELGVYKIFAFDKAGNRSEPYIVNVSDLPLPNISISPASRSELRFGVTNQPLSVNVSVTPSNGTGIARNYKYAVTTTATPPAATSAAWNTTSTPQGIVPVTSSGTYYVHVIGYDQSGNSNTAVGGPYRVDVTKPYFGTVTPTYRDNKTYVSTAFDDEHSGIYGYAIAPAGTAASSLTPSADEGSTSHTFEIDGSGDYVIYVWDKAGNVSDAKTVTATAHAPEVQFTPASRPDLVKDTTNKPANVAIRVVDSLNGPWKYKYVISASATAPAATDGSWTEVNRVTDTITIDQTGTYYIHAIGYDVLGNTGASTGGPYYVDVTKPVVDSASSESRDGKYYINATYSDADSGILGYSIAKKGSSHTLVEAVGTSSHEFEVTEAGDYEVKAYDRAGNVSDAYVVTATAHEPDITATPASRPSIVSGETNQPVTVHVAVNDYLYGPKSFKYIVSTTSVFPASATTWRIVDSASGDVAIDSTGAHYLHVVGYDNKGNSKQATFGPYSVDITAPVITRADSSTRNNIAYVRVHAVDAFSGIAGYIMKPAGQQPFIGDMVNSTDSSYEFLIPDANDYRYYAVDRAGNISEAASATSPIDKPDLLVIPDKRDTFIYGETNEELVVQVNVLYKNYAPDNFKYYISASPQAPSATAGGWVQSLSPYGQVTFPNTGIWYLHVIGYDSQGNSRSGTFGPYYVDKTPPVVDSLETSFHDNKLYVKATFHDAMSGIAGYTFQPDDDYTLAPVEAPGATSAEFEVPYAGTYRFVAFDGAGNMSEVRKVTIDGEHTPGITASPSSRSPLVSGISNAAANVRVTVSDSLYGPKGFKYAVTERKNAPDADENRAWTEAASPDETVRISSSGEWYLHVIGYDSNDNAKAATFGPYVVDAVAPAISLSTSYTNNLFRVSMDFSDDYSGVAGYAFAPAGTNDASLVFSNSPESGSHTFTIEQPGDYQFFARDRAGNIARSGIVAVKGFQSPVFAVSPASTSDWVTSAPRVTVVFSEEGENKVALDRFRYVLDETDDSLSDYDTRQAIEVSANGIGTYARTWVQTGTSSATYSFDINESGRWRLHLAGFDANGNSVFGDYGLYTVDLFKPVLNEPIVEYRDNKAYIQLQATDDFSGVAGYSMSNDPNGMWFDTNTFTLSENGTYKFYAKDIAGNVSDAKEVTVRFNNAPVLPSDPDPKPADPKPTDPVAPSNNTNNSSNGSGNAANNTSNTPPANAANNTNTRNSVNTTPTNNTRNSVNTTPTNNTNTRNSVNTTPANNTANNASNATANNTNTRNSVNTTPTNNTAVNSSSSAATATPSTGQTVTTRGGSGSLLGSVSATTARGSVLVTPTTSTMSSRNTGTSSSASSRNTGSSASSYSRNTVTTGSNGGLIGSISTTTARGSAATTYVTRTTSSSSYASRSSYASASASSSTAARTTSSSSNSYSSGGGLIGSISEATARTSSVIKTVVSNSSTSSRNSTATSVSQSAGSIGIGASSATVTRRGASMPTMLTVTDETSSVSYAVTASAAAPVFASSYKAAFVEDGKAVIEPEGSGESYLHVIASDEAGNISEMTYGPYEIDTVAPTVISATPVFHDGMFEVAAEGSDDYSGVAGFAVVPQEGTGIIDVYAVDEAGNMSEPCAVAVPANESPVITAKDSEDGLSVSVAAETGNGGFAEAKHIVDSNPATYYSEDDGDGKWQSDGVAEVPRAGDWYVHVVAEDGDGNTSVATLGKYSSMAPKTTPISPNLSLPAPVAAVSLTLSMLAISFGAALFIRNRRSKAL